MIFLWLTMEDHSTKFLPVLARVKIEAKLHLKTLLNFASPQAHTRFTTRLFPAFLLTLIGGDTNDAKKAKLRLPHATFEGC